MTNSAYLDVWSEINHCSIRQTHNRMSHIDYLYILQNCPLWSLLKAPGYPSSDQWISMFQWIFPLSFQSFVIKKKWSNFVVYKHLHDFMILLFSKFFPGQKKKKLNNVKNKISFLSSGFLSSWDPLWSHKAFIVWNNTEIQSSEILWTIYIKISPFVSYIRNNELRTK